MKRKIDGEFIFTAALGLFVLACLVETGNLPPTLQIASYLAGFITLALIVLLAAGRFRPELLRWTETALQDLWGGSNKDAATLPPEEVPPWPAIVKSMSYAVGFLGFSFLLGFVLAVPLGWVAYRYRLTRGLVLTVVGLLYTIPCSFRRFFSRSILSSRQGCRHAGQYCRAFLRRAC